MKPGSHGAFAAALYGGMDEDAVWERQYARASWVEGDHA
jgi:hypothetical protein